MYFSTIFSASILSLVVLSIDFIFRFSRIQKFSSENLVFYSISVFLSFLFWVIRIDILFYLNRLKKPLYFLVLGSFSLFYSFLIIGSYSYFQFSKILPNYFSISYIFQEPKNSFTLVRDSTNFFGLGLIVLFAILLFLFLNFIIDQKKKVSNWKFLVAIVLFFVLFPFLVHNTRYRDQVYIADTNGYSFIVKILYNELTGDKLGSAGLQSRTPYTLGDTQDLAPKYNVLLIVAESLRRKSMGLYGYDRNTTPNLNKFRLSNPNNFFLFQKAYSNATSTLISFPSILTGVLPNEPTTKTHNSPIFWEFGKAKGYSTFYITSHDLKWNNLNGYFANAGIDYLWSRDSYPGLLFNDLGIDDRETFKELKHHLSKLKNTNKNFFGVFHLNTNHFPYYHPDEFEVWKKGKPYDYYDNSVLFMDSIMGEFLKYLKSSGLDKNTIVIFTSDHGESVGEHGYFGHIESNYIDTISIPLFFYIPSQIQKTLKLPRKDLTQNLENNVMNGDIIPTVIELLNRKTKNSWNKNNLRLEGMDLFGNIPDDRELFIVNNNEISLYKVGFSQIKKNWHYIYNYLGYPEYEELYDLSNDPGELKNIWNIGSNEFKTNTTNSFQKCQICMNVRGDRDKMKL